MGQNLNANEPVDEDVAGHGLWQNSNEPVSTDDVSGHGITMQHNESVAEDSD